MDSLSKITGDNGGFFMDDSFSGGFVYAIHVLTDAVFTVLTEGDESSAAGTDAMGEQNLASKTVTAGALLVPQENVFKSATITSGTCYCYKAGE